MAAIIGLTCLVIGYFFLASKGIVSAPGVGSKPAASAPAVAVGGLPAGTKNCTTGDATSRAHCKLAKAYAFQKLNGDVKQFDCLDNLWYGESGWSDTIVNSSSQAYGIPQILPEVHGHPVAMGDWKAQVDWGLNYISKRYKTACAAWSFWLGKNPHWY